MNLQSIPAIFVAKQRVGEATRKLGQIQRVPPRSFLQLPPLIFLQDPEVHRESELHSAPECTGQGRPNRPRKEKRPLQ